jgi:thioredoxin 1
MGIDINADSFENEVIQSDIPVVVDFWGPKCGPCLALMPDVEQLEKNYDGKIKLVKIDATQNRRFCLSLKVLGLPTYLFYKDGQELARLSGESLGLSDIEKSVKKIIS